MCRLRKKRIYYDLEEAFFMWISKMNAKCITLSAGLLIKKAKCLLIYLKLQILTFFVWLTNLKKGYSLTKKVMHGK